MYQSCLYLSWDASEQQAHNAERKAYRQSIRFGLSQRQKQCDGFNLTMSNIV